MLAGQLYYMGESTALEAVKKYVKVENSTGILISFYSCSVLFPLLTLHSSPPLSPGLTCDEVCSVLTQVDNWIEFGKCLDIPVSDLKTIDRTQPKPHAVKEMVQKWLQNHPAPSWSLVREALYQRGYYEPNLHQISKNAYIN